MWWNAVIVNTLKASGASNGLSPHICEPHVIHATPTTLPPPLPEQGGHAQGPPHSFLSCQEDGRFSSHHHQSQNTSGATKCSKSYTFILSLYLFIYLFQYYI